MPGPEHAQSFSYIDPASRIQSAVHAKRLNDKLDEQRSGDKNDPASRWQRGTVLAGRLAENHIQTAPAVHPQPEPCHQRHDGQRSPDRLGNAACGSVKPASASLLPSRLPFHFKDQAEEQEYIEESKIMTKRMEDQNWLEMLDPKHRYGSNMKHYHRYWNTKAQTDQNFLHWLDEGDGKDLSLEECPRSKLETERITYLTPDQRRNYLTFIDTDPWPQDVPSGSDRMGDMRAKLSRIGASPSLRKLLGSGESKGRLRWCRTGELVNTSKYDHGDLGHGRGVALRGSDEWQAAVNSGEAADVVRSDKVKVRRRDSDSSSGSYTSCSDGNFSSARGSQESVEAGLAAADPNPSAKVPKPSLDDKHQSKREKWLEKANLGPKYLVKHKLGLYAAKERQQHIPGNSNRPAAAELNEASEGVEQPGGAEQGRSADGAPSADKLIRRRKGDTWLFVADLSGNMYIGIKTRGQFQHSSFLGGSIVAAAGILKVKDGIITSIYPWSGHYRSGGEHFEALVERLRERGLDTSGINVRKSKLVIEGVNRYGRYRKAKDRRQRDFKEKLKEKWERRIPQDVDAAAGLKQPDTGGAAGLGQPGTGGANDTVKSAIGAGSVGCTDGETCSSISEGASGLGTEQQPRWQPEGRDDSERALEHCVRAMQTEFRFEDRAS